MQDVVIVSSATRANDRYESLVDMIDPDEFSVEFITSKFVHPTKRFRDLSKEQPEKLRCKVTYLDELGYKKNISLRRIRSNFVLGRNLYRYLEQRKKPDLIFAVIPALEMAYYAARFASEHHIPFILDLRDLWPEAYRMVFNLPVLRDLFFAPVARHANYVYSHSDAVVAVSETFLKRAARNAKPGIPMEKVVLGTDLRLFEQYVGEHAVPRNDSEIWIGYVGTLGRSYDIEHVIDALATLKKAGYGNLRFVVLGGGFLKERFEAYAEKKGVLCEFTGKLPYPEMAGRLAACDIAVNPIVRRSAGSLINKVADYAAAGLPVLNSQECEEYRELVDRYRCGLNCRCEDAPDMAKKLKALIDDPQLRKTMGANSRRLAADVFDRRVEYPRIIELFRRFRREA